MSPGAMLPPLNNPMCEKVLRLPRVMVFVSMPPMDKPAIAR
jgi:hypothetical protein